MPAATSYPNKLRKFREEAFLTRASLAGLCDQLAQSDAVRYTAVSEHTIKKLESEDSQPRASTATTLAAALKMDVARLFPNGIDLKNRRVDRKAH